MPPAAAADPKGHFLPTDPHARFAKGLAAAASPDAAFDALYRLSDALVPVRLWTVMALEPETALARRAYSNMPQAYPASGTKPIVENAWSEIVRGQQKPFVANTLAEIAEVFPDHALIGSLGCGSVLNLPVAHDGTVIGTVNLLDAEHRFTPAFVKECEATLTGPARAAMLKARALPGPHEAPGA